MLALLLVALSVGLDNYGAAAALGISGAGSHGRLKVAAAFGAFEAAMPLFGLFLGHTVAKGLGDHGDLVAGVVLCMAGLFALVQDLRGRGSKNVAPPHRPPGFGRLVVLAAALSIDNLAVGFALGASHVKRGPRGARHRSCEHRADAGRPGARKSLRIASWPVG
ncbi:MAG: manganese efflux pump MntP family protein [Acidimicrobiales bacterium]